MSFKALTSPMYVGRPPWLFNVATTPVTLGGFTIDASGEKLAYVFQAPKAGNLRKVYLRIGAVATARDLKVSFQDLDASGDPDGTPDQYRVIPQASVVSNTAVLTGIMSSDGTDNGSLRAVVPGSILAVVIEFDSTAGDLILTTFNSSSAVLTAIPYLDHFTSSWAKNVSSPIVAIEYDDGTYAQVEGMYPFVGGLNSFTFNSGTLGADERGSRFLLPFPARVSGLWAWVDYDNACDLVLYSGTTALATVAFPAAAVRQNAAAGLIRLFLATPIDLQANTEYRVAVKPGASNVVFRGGIVSAAALLGAYCGAEFYSTARLDLGAWSDDQTAVNYCGPMVTHIGAGGGSLVNGGLVY